MLARASSRECACVCARVWMCGVRACQRARKRERASEGARERACVGAWAGQRPVWQEAVQTEGLRSMLASTLHQVRLTCWLVTLNRP